jgi:hypothetical protein
MTGPRGEMKTKDAILFLSRRRDKRGSRARTLSAPDGVAR